MKSFVLFQTANLLALLGLIFVNGCVTNPGPPTEDNQTQIIGTVIEFSQKIDKGYANIYVKLKEHDTELYLRSKTPVSGEWKDKKTVITYTVGDYNGGGGWITKFEEASEYAEKEYERITEE